MAINSVGSGSPQAVTNRLLQKMPPPGSGSGEPDGFSAMLGDLMTLSPNKAAAGKPEAAPPPPAVSQAMSDLFNGQKDVQADLAQLKGYFAQSPQALNSLMGALQNGAVEATPEVAEARKRTDDRQAQAIAKYLTEAQKSDSREADRNSASGVGVIELFG